MNLKDWMELVDYRITEGSDFGWSCFGPNAYSLSSWNGDYDGYSMNIVFDTKTQVVYCVEACDYKNNRAYRYLNPTYSKNHKSEVKYRDDNDHAWDDVPWVDLEVYEDWRTKATAIVMGEDYDTRVTIPLDLPEDELMFLFKQAHEADMTFNDYVEQILRRAFENEEFIKTLENKRKNDITR